MDEQSLKGYLHDIAKEFSDTEWVDGNRKWVQLYPYGSWTHPLFSDTTIDKVVADKLVKNFDDKVVGRELVVEYDHGLDKAKGGKAAGVVVKQEAREDGLYGLVEFNEVAKTEIDNGEWRYMSNSHYDSWTNPQTQETHEFVPENPSLTNRPYVRGMSPINFSEIVMEHGSEHASEQDGDVTITKEEYDKLIDPGNVHKGGETEVDDAEFQKALREKLGLGDDVDLMAHIAGINDEVGPLRELKKEHSERKAFSDIYPEQAAELERLRISERENFAKQFSDNLATARVVRKSKTEGSDEVVSTPTGLGFSALVLDKIRDEVKAFSDGKATLEGFKGVLDSITDDGIVDYGVHGSERTVDVDDEVNRTAPKDFSDARKQFSDIVFKIQEDDKLDLNAAMAQAAEKYPELYQAYKTKKPVVNAAG